jgi:DNA repair ATPase RecN
MTHEQVVDQIIEAAKKNKPWSNDFRSIVSYLVSSANTETEIQVFISGATSDRMIAQLNFDLDFISNQLAKIEPRVKDLTIKIRKYPSDNLTLQEVQEKEKMRKELDKLYKYQQVYSSILNKTATLINFYLNAKKQEVKSI